MRCTPLPRSPLLVAIPQGQDMPAQSPPHLCRSLALSDFVCVLDAQEWAQAPAAGPCGQPMAVYLCLHLMSGWRQAGLRLRPAQATRAGGCTAGGCAGGHDEVCAWLQCSCWWSSRRSVYHMQVSGEALQILPGAFCVLELAHMQALPFCV